MLSSIRSVAVATSRCGLAGGFSFTQPCRFKIYKAPPKPKRKMPRDTRLAVILMQDVHKLGVQGQEVLVKRGFARNDLLFHKKAVYASEENRRKFKTVFDLREEGGDANSTARQLERVTVEHFARLPTHRWKMRSMPDDITLLEKPLNRRRIHDKMLRLGFSWLMEEQVIMETGVTEITKFEDFSFSIDLSKGLIPLGNAIVHYDVMLDRWLPQAEIDAEKARQREIDEKFKEKRD